MVLDLVLQATVMLEVQVLRGDECKLHHFSQHILCLCSSPNPKAFMLHIRDTGLFIMSLADYIYGCDHKGQFWHHHSTMTLFQKFWGLSRCCLAYCKHTVLWHWRSNGFFLVTPQCSPFLLKCLLIVDLETVTLLSCSEAYISAEGPWGFFFASLPIILAVEAKIFDGLPEHGLLSTGPLSRRLWAVLTSIFKVLAVFLYPLI